MLATMKANSPSCVSAKPHCILVLSGWPDNMTPSDVKRHLPKISVTESAMMVSRLPLTTVGSTIMPTDTKKMPENRFLTGSSKTLVRLVYTVPESSVPIKNAPSADHMRSEHYHAEAQAQRNGEQHFIVKIFAGLFKKAG